MENYIIIAILIIVVLISIRSSVKHFKGEGGCCGGGKSYKPKKKKLPNVIEQRTFKVSGMHCEHCKNRVEEEVNDIPDVAGKVDLKKGEVLVSYAKPVDNAIIKEKIERAGYTVTEIL